MAKSNPGDASSMKSRLERLLRMTTRSKSLFLRTFPTDREVVTELGFLKDPGAMDSRSASPQDTFSGTSQEGMRMYYQTTNKKRKRSLFERITRRGSSNRHIDKKSISTPFALMPRKLNATHPIIDQISQIPDLDNDENPMKLTLRERERLFVLSRQPSQRSRTISNSSRNRCISDPNTARPHEHFEPRTSSTASKATPWNARVPNSPVVTPFINPEKESRRPTQMQRIDEELSMAQVFPEPRPVRRNEANNAGSNRHATRVRFSLVHLEMESEPSPPLILSDYRRLRDTPPRIGSGILPVLSSIDLSFPFVSFEIMPPTPPAKDAPPLPSKDSSLYLDINYTLGDVKSGNIEWSRSYLWGLDRAASRSPLMTSGVGITASQDTNADIRSTSPRISRVFSITKEDLGLAASAHVLDREAHGSATDMHMIAEGSGVRISRHNKGSCVAIRGGSSSSSGYDRSSRASSVTTSSNTSPRSASRETSPAVSWIYEGKGAVSLGRDAERSISGDNTGKGSIYTLDNEGIHRASVVSFEQQLSPTASVKVLQLTESASGLNSEDARYDLQRSPSRRAAIDDEVRSELQDKLNQDHVKWAFAQLGVDVSELMNWDKPADADDGLSPDDISVGSSSLFSDDKRSSSRRTFVILSSGSEVNVMELNYHQQLWNEHPLHVIFEEDLEIF